MNLLERLRHANNATKAQVSFLGALVATLIITGVWATTLPARFSSENIASEAPLATEKSAAPNMFGGFGEAIKNQFASAIESFETPPAIEEAPVLDTTEDAPLVTEELLPTALDLPTSSSSPTTTPPSVPRPAVIQISTTPTTASATPTVATTTSEALSPPSIISEPAPAPTPRVIMIATTTGSGTQMTP